MPPPPLLDARSEPPCAQWVIWHEACHKSDVTGVRWPMSRRQKEPLRALSDEERKALSQLSRSGRSPSGRVARATALLAVAEGQSYTAAAKQVGRRNGDTVALWVARFNREGLAAVVPRHGGGAPPRGGGRAGGGARRSAMPHSSSGAFSPRPSGSRTEPVTARRRGP